MDAIENEIFNTIEDIYALPDGERAELIDGRLYMMALPNRKHQKILNYLNTEINVYIRGHNGDCEVYPAPFAVFLNADDETYVEPDISVICNPDKLTDKGCEGAPDWVIEIVSPSSRMMDYYRKLFRYRASGVREYWIVDPERDMVTVYNFEHETVRHYSFRDEVPSGIYDGFSIKIEL